MKYDTCVNAHLDFKQNEENFMHMFNQKFRATLDMLFFQQAQLKLGNRLRPRLVYWGYCATKRSAISEQEMDRISDLAISIELIHKASIILDDLFDSDDARHGQKAFHIEFGENNTVLFASYMVNHANINLNRLQHYFEDNKEMYIKSEQCLFDTVKKLSLGCLQELNIGEKRYSVEEIRKIINLETSTLLKNSMLFGYYYGCAVNNNYNVQVEKVLSAAGLNCGYVFQTMNDLEPLYQQGANSLHKGQLNIDFVKMRKNIVIAELYERCSDEEKKYIRSFEAKKGINCNEISKILLLIKKYHIFSNIFKEIDFRINEINEQLTYLQSVDYCSDWCKQFNEYILVIEELCKKRLY